MIDDMRAPSHVSKSMIIHHAEGDPASGLAERRWFACITAMRSVRGECETLREVVEMAQSSLRRARAELARLEAIRDALDDQMAAEESVERGDRGSGAAVSPSTTAAHAPLRA